MSSYIELAEPWTIDVAILGNLYQKTQDAIQITKKEQEEERALAQAQDRAAELTQRTELKSEGGLRHLVIGVNLAFLALAALAYYWRRRNRT